MRRAVVIAALALASGGCRSRASGSEAPAPRIEAEISGCATFDADGSCVLDDDGVVRIWLPFPWREDIRVFVGDRAIAPESTVMQSEGARMMLRVPTDARELAVHARFDHDEGTWSIAVRVRNEPRALEDARHAKREGRLADAARALAPAIDAMTLRDRARALGLLARVELAEGAVADAEAHFRSALARDREAGLFADEARDALSLVFVLVQRQYRFGDAHALLESVRASASRFPDGRALLPYSVGLLAFETGDLRNALAAFRNARSGALRLGLAYAERAAADRVAATLQLLGRTREAIAILEELRAAPTTDDVPGCEAVDLRNNLGWFRLHEDEATAQGAVQAAQALFVEALTRFPSSCADMFRKSHVLTNLAIAAVRSGDASRAKGYLANARAASSEPAGALAAWWLELEGEIALREGRAEEAVRAFKVAEQDAAREHAFDAHWRALVARGEAHERLRNANAALAAYEEAEAMLDRSDIDVPLGEGRGSFLRAHVTSAARRIDLLVRLGRTEAALDAVERSRTRLLDGIARSTRMAGLAPEARAGYERALGEYRRGRDAISVEAAHDKELPSDELARAQSVRADQERALRDSLDRAIAAIASSSPRARAAPVGPGVGLTLAMHPSPREGWVVIVREAAGPVRAVHIASIDMADVDSLAKALFTPFHAEIARAARIEVRAYGELASVDVHSLLYEGAPLLVHAVVVYALGVPGTSSTAHASRAAVVGDPRSDLPWAREEALAVSRVLDARGAQTEVLLGERATRAEVARAIAHADFVHYAGHAVHAGLDGWESGFALADSDTFTVGDVLAIDHVPSAVVLAGCDAGRGANEGSLEALALAHAFIVSGTRSAIAPTREVDDRDSASFVRALYESAAIDDDLAAAARAAVLALRAERPSADWAAYRVFVP